MTDKKIQAPSKVTTIKAPDIPGESHDATLARLAAAPCITAALVSTTFAHRFGNVDVNETADVLRKSAERVHGGDLREVETMLTAQAIALNNIFTETALRSALNMGEYTAAAETYMRLALRAQSQCRATLETLATIKNPPVVFAKQANIAHGHQQVNNGIAHAKQTESEQPELLEHDHGERLDTGTAATAGGSHPAVATVEALHRPAQRRRQGRIEP